MLIARGLKLSDLDVHLLHKGIVGGSAMDVIHDVCWQLFG